VTPRDLARERGLFKERLSARLDRLGRPAARRLAMHVLLARLFDRSASAQAELERAMNVPVFWRYR
jgi:hypothetical protein